MINKIRIILDFRQLSVEEWEKVEFWTTMEAAQLLFMASIPDFAERKGCLCTYYAVLTSSLFLQPQPLQPLKAAC